MFLGAHTSLQSFPPSGFVLFRLLCCVKFRSEASLLTYRVLSEERFAFSWSRPGNKHNLWFSWDRLENVSLVKNFFYKNSDLVEPNSSTHDFIICQGKYISFCWQRVQIFTFTVELMCLKLFFEKVSGSG